MEVVGFEFAAETEAANPRDAITLDEVLVSNGLVDEVTKDGD